MGPSVICILATYTEQNLPIIVPTLTLLIAKIAPCINNYPFGAWKMAFKTKCKKWCPAF